MFESEDYQFLQFQLSDVDEYLIESGDEIRLQVYSREGVKLIEVTEQSNTATNVQRGSVTYWVREDGTIDLPVIGSYYVANMTSAELKSRLEKEYAQLFSMPYVYIEVVNRRAFVFKEERASVIELNQTPTTVIEVLAKFGGLGHDQKAYNILVIRGDLANPQVYNVNLSSMGSLENADLIIQPNDIIYIDFRRRIVRDTLAEASPVITILTAIVTSVILLRGI